MGCSCFVIMICRWETGPFEHVKIHVGGSTSGKFDAPGRRTDSLTTIESKQQCSIHESIRDASHGCTLLSFSRVRNGEQ